MRDLIIVVLVFAVFDVYANRLLKWLNDRRDTAAMWASYDVGLLAAEYEMVPGTDEESE